MAGGSLGFTSDTILSILSGEKVSDLIGGASRSFIGGDLLYDQPAGCNRKEAVFIRGYNS